MATCRSWFCRSTRRWSGWTARCSKPLPIWARALGRRSARVIVPLSAPGIRAGAILVFIPCLGAYLTPDLLGGGKSVMIGNLIQNQFTTARDWPFGSAVSLVLMAIVMVLLFVIARGRRRRSAVKRAELGLAIYAIARLSVSASAAADSGHVQLQCRRASRFGRASRCAGTRLRCTITQLTECRAQQPDHRRGRHGGFDGDRHAVRLRAVEAQLAAAGRLALPVAGHAGDRDRHFAARVLSMDLPLPATCRSACTR